MRCSRYSLWHDFFKNRAKPLSGTVALLNANVEFLFCLNKSFLDMDFENDITVLDPALPATLANRKSLHNACPAFATLALRQILMVDYKKIPD